MIGYYTRYIGKWHTHKCNSTLTVMSYFLQPSKKIARSQSDGTLCFPESMKKLAKNRDQREPVVLQVPARELSDIKIASYLDKKNIQGEWER